MELLETLNELNNAAHHLVMGGTICFLNNLIAKKRADYLKEGVKNKLWVNDNIENEIKMLNADLSKISNKQINEINETNITEVLFNISRFIIQGYSIFISDKSMFEGLEPKKIITKAFKQKRTSEFDVWLRFYFRLKDSVTEASAKVDNMTNYIG